MDQTCLNRNELYLNKKGSLYLAKNFMDLLNFL